ncbi:MAG: tRNA epoxyqueuosine(34) reductase QueG [Candidatus Contendobacter sp.]|nr:tRNA epoxyqueuosine(34) reductase QueG [Candidatus Contendobacter sp.]
MTVALSIAELAELAAAIKIWGRELGFQQIGIADIDLREHEAWLLDWLAAGFHGAMDYMARHGVKRSRPAELVPGTVRAITARLDYLPPAAADPWRVLPDPELGYLSRYALGRDYHKVLRNRLQRLADRIAAAIGPFGCRVFTDSAPVLEKALAERAGLGWIGKHSNLLNRQAGSWFFLGEIYVDLPLPADAPGLAHCGRCVACLDACPTRAIVAPYRVDARRCLSYLTIELHGPIPLELRRSLGNRIYGCDDCQLVCPWNRFAQVTAEPDFRVRHGLDAPGLVDLFGWDEAEFLRRTEGSAIRRIGHERWLRNIAVALGNAPHSPAVIAALQVRQAHASALVREHVAWALETNQHVNSAATGIPIHSARSERHHQKQDNFL